MNLVQSPAFSRDRSCSRSSSAGRSLSSVERTRARLRIIEEVSVALGLDAVNVVPLSGALPALRREIHEDGVLLYGSLDEADAPADGDTELNREETLAQFDRILTDMEQTV